MVERYTSFGASSNLMEVNDMGSIEIKSILEGFILEIKKCSSCDEARDIRKRIHDFYQTHDVPKDKDVLAESGMCECLAMLTGDCFF